MLRMKAPLLSETMAVSPSLLCACDDVTALAENRQPVARRFAQKPAHAAPRRRSARGGKNARWFLRPHKDRASDRCRTAPLLLRWWPDRRRYRRPRRPADRREMAAW